jgi:hypothetical protein
MNRVAGMATIPDREEMLKIAVDSIYNQVDAIYIAFNNYKEFPEWIDDRKIHAFITDNTFGDAEKFRHVGETNQYFFSIDDDLVYAPDYVEYMIDGIERYKSIVTLQGRNYPVPVSSFLKYIDNYKCYKEVSKDIKVHLGGTDVMAFDINTYQPDFAIFKKANMADSWIAMDAFNKDIPIWVLKHPDQYIGYSNPKKTIWNSWRDDTTQSSILKSFLNK